MAPETEKQGQGTQRHARAGDDSSSSGKRHRYDKSWAVLIGVDNYKTAAPLARAVKDACDVACLLVGRFEFPPQNVFLFLDRVPTTLPLELSERRRDPTKGDIEELLLTELPQMVGPDDRVLVFYAGHGEPREYEGVEQKKDWYMVPVEGKPGKWHTLINIRYVYDSLNRSKAKHVLYILDSCYSGIAGEQRSAGAAPKRFHAEMLSSRAQQVISAGSARQAAADLGEGGGNSLFTEYLLRGLGEGKADTNRDGSITANELGSYLREEVAEAYGSGQKPGLSTLANHESGGDFVFNVPRFFLTSAERERLAGLLTEELGFERAEASALRFASTLLDQAAEGRLLDGPGESDEARRLRPRIRFGLRLLGAADAAELGLLSGDGASRQAPMAEDRLLDALIAFRNGEREKAENTLRSLVQEDRNGACGALAAWALQQPETGGRAVALLVGVSYSGFDHTLKGPKNDVEALRAVLEQTLGFDEVECLHDPSAKMVAEKLTDFGSRLQRNDSFLFYFSGFGARTTAEAGPPAESAPAGAAKAEQLVVYVFSDAVRQAKNGGKTLLDEAHGYLTELDIDRLMNAIPANKVVVTDGCHLAPRADVQGYRFLAACDRAGLCVEFITPEGVHRGAFTYALERVLAECPTAPFGTVARRVNDFVQNEFSSQRAVFMNPFPRDEPLTEHDTIMLDRLELALHGRVALGWDAGRDYSLLGRGALPILYQRVARAWVNRERYQNARQLMRENVLVDADTARSHVEVCVSAGDYAAAAAACSEWALRAPAEISQRVDQLRARLSVAGARKKRALFLSCSPRGGMVRAALDSWGFAAEHVVVMNPDDDAADLRGAFRQLVQCSEDPALLIIDSHKAADSVGRLIHGEPGGEVDADLARLAAQHQALTSILPVPLPPAYERAASDKKPPLGALTILLNFKTIHREVGFSLDPMVELIQALQLDGIRRVDQWLDSAGVSGVAKVLGNPKACLFEHPDDAIDIGRMLRGITGAPLAEAASLLRTMSFQPTRGGEEARLFLGVTFVAQGRLNEGLAEIDEALRLREEWARGAPWQEREGQHFAASSLLFWPDAHYQRGQALLALGRLGEAVDAFSEAARQSPVDALIHYHRARAIERLIAEDLKTQMQKARDTYEALGAPLGPFGPKQVQEVPWGKRMIRWR